MKEETEEPNWEEIAKIPKPADNKCSHAGCWSQGEMVGFAKCMVQKVKPLQSQLFHERRLRIEDGASGINEANQLHEEIASLKKQLSDLSAKEWALREVIEEKDKQFSIVKETLSAAITYIDESPCDPDITKKQTEAWSVYQEKLELLNKTK